MGFRIGVDNIPINEALLNEIGRRLNLKIKRGVRVKKGRPVFMLELKNGEKLRLDIHPIWRPKLNSKYIYQKLLYENGVNVAKPINFMKVKKITGGYRAWHLSEWIEGQRTDEVWNLEEVFKKLGEQVAKINSTKASNTWCIGLFDFSKLNGIWTKDKKIYIIDLSVKPYKNIKYSVYKLLTTSLRTRSRIDAFLKGYSKIRSTETIIKYAERKKWKYKGIELAPDEELIKKESFLNKVIKHLRGILNA